MKTTTRNQLTQAHGWIGISISGLLFIIFFAGSISLFKDEIYQWSVAPTHQVHSGPVLTIHDIAEIAIKDRPFNAKEHLSILTPSEKLPYFQVYVDLKENHRGEDYIGLLIDPVSGEIIGEIDSFFLPEFIYHLHESMNLPFGRYLIGFVSLFFFVMLMTGLLIHAKKLLNRFFLYRSDSNKRSQYLDMHNVIGTMSLPFTAMYAFTGLVFNLVIIYQIAFAVVLYKGDQNALLSDAGVHIIEPEWADKPMPMTRIDEQIQAFTHELENPPRFIRFYNYGDESAVMHLFGEVPNTFSSQYELGIEMHSKALLFKDSPEKNSAVKQGLSTLETLHFGSFAGTDLRLIYFVLGLMVCGLIVSGNLLWIEKRVQNKNASARQVTVLTKLTYISTVGIIVATAASFLAERLLPLTAFNRADYLVYCFVIALVAFSAFVMKQSNKHTTIAGFYLSAGLLVMTVLCDWAMYAPQLMQLWEAGRSTSMLVQIGMLFMAIAFIYCAQWMQRRVKRIAFDAPQNVQEQGEPA